MVSRLELFLNFDNSRGKERNKVYCSSAFFHYRAWSEEENASASQHPHLLKTQPQHDQLYIWTTLIKQALCFQIELH